MIVYICGGYFEDFVICEISLVRLERPAPTSFFVRKIWWFQEKQLTLPPIITICITHLNPFCLSTRFLLHNFKSKIE